MPYAPLSNLEISGSRALSAPNRTGLPNGLKTQLEGTFGTRLDHLRVKKNSGFPAKVGAIATTRGSQIDIAPGHFNPNSAQGRKLIGHEAWHTVQQAQGRVKPTLQMKTGHLVNDSEALEREADVMGERLSSRRLDVSPKARLASKSPSYRHVIQRVPKYVVIGKHFRKNIKLDAQALGLVAEKIKNVDLSVVTDVDNVIIDGAHGNSATFGRYNPVKLARKLYEKGLRACYNIELHGCETGRMFAKEFRQELRELKVAMAGSVIAPTTSGSNNSKGLQTALLPQAEEKMKVQLALKKMYRRRSKSSYGPVKTFFKQKSKQAESKHDEIFDNPASEVLSPSQIENHYLQRALAIQGKIDALAKDKNPEPMLSFLKAQKQQVRKEYQAALAKAKLAWSFS
ncbi:MAG: DUF4157 domain-containing protein [Bacteroidota bacterium]